MNYTIQKKTDGKLQKHGLRTEYWDDERVWHVIITFDTTISPKLYELIKSCLPTYVTYVKGKKTGWFSHELLPRPVHYGTVTLLQPNVVQVTFQDATYKTDSPGRQQFLSKLSEKLVKLTACSCGATATVSDEECVTHA